MAIDYLLQAKHRWRLWLARVQLRPKWKRRTSLKITRQHPRCWTWASIALIAAKRANRDRSWRLTWRMPIIRQVAMVRLALIYCHRRLQMAESNATFAMRFFLRLRSWPNTNCLIAKCPARLFAPSAASLYRPRKLTMPTCKPRLTALALRLLWRV